MAFSDKTLDFLQENSFRDSKEWFREHKDEFQQYVTEPFCEFIQNMQTGMHRIDNEIICNPKKLSRIYRDTRFSKNKSVFRSDLWYSFGRIHTPEHIVPEFYFDISPEGFSYGCGYYQAGADRMDVIRRMILEKDPAFLNAKKAMEQQTVFELGGEQYKKNHYPNCPEDVFLWLNRKNLYAATFSNDFSMLYREDLYTLISAEFYQIKELYYFFQKAEQKVQ